MSEGLLITSLHHTISAHTSDVNGVAFSNDYKLATCSGDKTARLWDMDDFSELPSSPLCGHSYHLHCCDFSPFGTTLVTCSTDGKLIVWDVKTGQKLITFQHPTNNSIRVCRFSPNSAYLASGSDDYTLCLWNVSAKKLMKTFTGHDACINACAFSPDSNFVVSGCSNGNLRAWDTQFGHGKPLVYILEGHDLGVTCIDFSPTYGTAASKNMEDSNQKENNIVFLLATCGQDNLVKLWLFSTILGTASVTLRVQNTLQGHTGPVMTCCFSPNGKLLASGSIDKTARLWDPETGSVLHIVEGHTRFVVCCAFSSDSQMIVTGSNDKTVMVWKITTQGEVINKLDAEQEKVVTTDVLDGSADAILAAKPMKTWTIDDACKWLENISMGQYCSNFKENEIDGPEIESLTDKMLETIGVGALGHRNKIIRAKKTLYRKQAVLQNKTDPSLADAGIPDEYLCPITREVMTDPVIAEDGYTYERSAITAWMSSGKGGRSPMTNSNFVTRLLTPNRSLKMLIQRHLNG